MKFLIGVLAILAGVPAVAADRPNIILMLADDQGWNGLSVRMHPDRAESRGDMYHTPHLERLAAQGMRFSQAYAPAPVCSPSRISIQTGRSPAALHWTKAAPPEAGHKLSEPRNIKQIADREVTIGELLRRAGYATAHYGKWHINGGGPGQHGYDESDGDTGNEQAFEFKDPNPVDIFGMAERAERFMAKCARAGQPFYIQLSWNALHASQNALQATRAKYEQKLGARDSKRADVAAITEDLDTGVGRVLDSIERLGLTGNTYVIYTSDNGAGGGKKLLHGGKGDVYEGGIRVPLIVRGPGVKPNSFSSTPVVGYDFLPTFCEWAGLPRSAVPAEVEGGSFTALLAQNGQGAVQRPREELVFHFPHYQGDTPHSAILLGNLKLMHFYEDDRYELYDLGQDLSERHNIAAERPAETRRLSERLQKYLAAVDAQLPPPNPDFDPNRPAEPRKRGGKNKPEKPRKS
ncbi:MAG: sulfatase [Planctomycetes bacterium]|nr:sulfatase [Planctomycetota bacterium]